MARNRNAWEASFPILHLLLSPKYFTVLRIDLTVDAVVNSSVLLLLSYLLGAGDKLRTSCLLGKCSTTDPCPSPSIKSVFFLLAFFFGVCLFFIIYLFIFKGNEFLSHWFTSWFVSLLGVFPYCQPHTDLASPPGCPSPNLKTPWGDTSVPRSLSWMTASSGKHWESREPLLAGSIQGRLASSGHRPNCKGPL